MKNPIQLIKGAYNKFFYYCAPAKIYLNKQYKAVFGRNINWKNPTTYNEKLQWLKVYGKNSTHAKLVDKYEVREYIKDKIGEKYLIPLLGAWERVEDINFDELPNQFVLKCTHDSGSVLICKDKDTFDIAEAKSRLAKRLKMNFYYNCREYPYKYIKKPRIIAEKYMINDNDSAPLDYKFMCFEGEPRVLFLDIGVCETNNLGGHAEHYYRNIYDMNFIPIDMKETREHIDLDKIQKPSHFEEMKKIAQTLCQGLHHCRVDLYEINGEIYFGEITFFHGAGYNYFDPIEWDKTLGDWIQIP